MLLLLIKKYECTNVFISNTFNWMKWKLYEDDISESFPKVPLLEPKKTKIFGENPEKRDKYYWIILAINVVQPITGIRIFTKFEDNLYRNLTSEHKHINFWKLLKIKYGD